MANPAKGPSPTFLPREHGATAMLLTPFVAAVILLRRFYWPELAALLAIAVAFAMKDPMVVLARQRFIWRQEHSETRQARRAVLMLAALLLASGLILVAATGWRPWAPFLLGGGAFTSLAVAMNVRNKQRSEWFQVASGVALTASCLIACLSAIDRIPEWCWLLWMLCALQSTTGIFVVHARLDARIAAHKNIPARNRSRRTAFCAVTILIAAAAFSIALQRYWISAALILSSLFHLAELRRQRDPASLQTPLTVVGLRALAQSTAYAAFVVIGLWRL